jgi:hypothetical protein
MRFQHIEGETTRATQPWEFEMNGRVAEMGLLQAGIAANVELTLSIFGRRFSILDKIAFGGLTRSACIAFYMSDLQH